MSCIYTVSGVGCLQWNVLIAPRLQRFYVRVFIRNLYCDDIQPNRNFFAIALQTGATRSEDKQWSRLRWIDEGFRRKFRQGLLTTDGSCEVFRGTWFRIGQRTVLFVGWLYCCEIKSDEDRSDSISGVNTGSLIPLRSPSKVVSAATYSQMLPIPSEVSIKKSHLTKKI